MTLCLGNSIAAIDACYHSNYSRFPVIMILMLNEEMTRDLLD